MSPAGGILADEMGLGKTVEVLACMLNHPRADVPKIEKRPVIVAKEVGINQCHFRLLERPIYCFTCAVCNRFHCDCATQHGGLVQTGLA